MAPCVDVVDLRLEEGGHHERPVGQPAEPGGVLELDFHGDVTGLAHGAHPACRSVAEPKPTVMPPRPFAVDDPIDKGKRFNSFDHGLTCSSNTNLCARFSRFWPISSRSSLSVASHPLPRPGHQRPHNQYQ